MIDAYFLDKLTHSEDRVLLVKKGKQGLPSGEIGPIPYNLVILYIEEGFRATEEAQHTSLRLSEILESIFYNQSVYMRNREREIMEKTMKKIFRDLYSKLLSILKDSPKYDLTWHDISVRGTELLFDGEADKVYTRLYLNDNRFREEVDRLTKQGKPY
ncbi:hypothetical protein KN1_12560 [Stygiolobus caldivivus]|uniref:Uncharacterized protein n=2 Tax=Stygiolobus caldivivus TaxID=2824673 RepID=A0A8D5ZHS3_9CREN|nr:hypothetical protein KN1_12560 [Stygiolobus caldivivus]